MREYYRIQIVLSYFKTQWHSFKNLEAAQVFKTFGHIQIFTKLNTHPRWTGAKPRGTSAAAGRAGASPAASLAEPSRLPRYNNIQPSTKTSSSLALYRFSYSPILLRTILNLTDDVSIFDVFFIIEARQRLRSRSPRAHQAMTARDHFHYALRHFMHTVPVNPVTVVETHLLDNIWNLTLIIVGVTVFIVYNCFRFVYFIARNLGNCNKNKFLISRISNLAIKFL